VVKKTTNLLRGLKAYTGDIY